MNSAAEIIARLKAVVGAKRDADLLRELDVKASTISSWRARNSVPSRLLSQFAKERGVSLDWLEHGLGKMRVAQDQGGYQVTAEHVAQIEPATCVPARCAATVEDQRLAAVLAWWQDWWAAQDEDERTWALVQFRRAIPEADDFIRRWLQVHGPT